MAASATSMLKNFGVEKCHAWLLLSWVGMLPRLKELWRRPSQFQAAWWQNRLTSRPFRHFLLSFPAVFKLFAPIFLCFFCWLSVSDRTFLKTEFAERCSGIERDTKLPWLRGAEGVHHECFLAVGFFGWSFEQLAFAQRPTNVFVEVVLGCLMIQRNCFTSDSNTLLICFHYGSTAVRAGSRCVGWSIWWRSALLRPMC